MKNIKVGTKLKSVRTGYIYVVDKITKNRIILKCPFKYMSRGKNKLTTTWMTYRQYHEAMEHKVYEIIED